MTYHVRIVNNRTTKPITAIHVNKKKEKLQVFIVTRPFTPTDECKSHLHKAHPSPSAK